MKTLVYMGTPEYAKIILESIIDSKLFDIKLVITQPDRPVGRKQELHQPPVKELAVKHNIGVLQPNSLKDIGVHKAILNLKPDFIVVAAFGQMLPREILNIAPCINLHASLLPLYRGASPVQQSILNNDKFTGVTAMLMEEGLDSGPILGYRYFNIPYSMKIESLMDKLSFDAATLTIDTLRIYDALSPVVQTKAASSHCKKIKKEDGLVDFNSTSALYSKFKAFHGWPNIFLSSGLKIVDMKLIDTNTNEDAGKIISIEDNSITVGCRDGLVQINELQPASKNKMSAKAYLLGKGLKIGDYLL